VQGTATDDLGLLVWRALSSIDPGRDLRVLGRKIGVDATYKGPEEGHPRTWPAELRHPAAARDKATTAARSIGLIP
jgi:4-hydroxy-3-polyprenylbenzoate decarboxylase